MKVESVLYEIKDGIAVPTPEALDEIGWTLRYGSEEIIIKHRLYIAHIVSLYQQSQQK